MVVPDRVRLPAGTLARDFPGVTVISPFRSIAFRWQTAAFVDRKPKCRQMSRIVGP